MGANSSQTATQSASDTVSETEREFHHLTGFQRDLLVALADLEKPSGQTIKDQLEARLNKDITHGRLYPNLDTLVTEGFVDKGAIDRRTNYYAISKTGQDALAQYIEWASTHAED
ncbi:PadR family transcriptional regulator [Halomarina litorea]|uniref:PadR family transcriptional regulator n=1 Tax=Halomarina litorea TaxID=2961595 RepID=UPI0020C21FB3|nr:PadR family transcriptional regulator [Halomarina sp. BCD28]